MEQVEKLKYSLMGHNPYFSRWFSAIPRGVEQMVPSEVTILILVDGFLQYKKR